MKEFITNLNKTKLFNEIDFHFAEFISRLERNNRADLFLSAALVSNITGNGDICLDLNAYDQKMLGTTADTRESIACPALPGWRKDLLDSAVVGGPGDFRPLILDGKNRLYLYRYWEYQNKLADSIRQKATDKMTGVNLTVLEDGLKRFFVPSAQPVDWQLIAAIAAVLNRFCVISGGPGTGKTHLVAKILALLIEQDDGRNLRIFLAAPTGKAAMKLSETLKGAISGIPSTGAVRDAMPTEACTLHRLLRNVPHSPYFHYCESNPLPADVVIVDEASMIDLALMSKLFQGLPAACRVILVGDRDQLASVEPGSVLGDMCDQNHLIDFSENFCGRVRQLTGITLKAPDIRIRPDAGLHDSMVTLQRNYRFSATGGIGEFSGAVKTGNAPKAAALLDKKDDPGIVWENAFSAAALGKILEQSVVMGYAPYLQLSEPLAALESLNRFQVLCVLNRGPFGVKAVNHLIERILIGKGWIADVHRSQLHWYRGRPVIITRNDYRLGLYNGDIGVTLPDPKLHDDALYVFFPGPQGEPRRFIPQQLPDHETVFAMTVHKSQGSEFAKILLILPDKDVAVLTRELIYTAVTRAREQVVICGGKAILQNAVSRGINRTSGLRDALWREP